MTHDDTIDGEAIEEPTTTDETGLVPAPPDTREVLRPLLDPQEAEANMAAYQQLCRAILKDSDYQTAERGKKFVKKSGWRKIATYYGLSVEIISLDIDRDDNGLPLRATVVARATAPNGRVSDGDGYCSADESRFNRQQGRQKLENDLRATATTRAKNRAISDLVGMGEVSAEEVTGFGHDAQVQLMDADQVTNDIAVPLSSLIGTDTAHKVIEWVKSKHGGASLPLDVGVGMAAVAKAASRHECSPDRDPAA